VRIRFLINFWTILELLCLFSTYLSFIGSEFSDPTISKLETALKAIRFFRVLRLNKHLKSIELLWAVLKAKFYNILSALVLLLTTIIIAATIIYLIEHDNNPVAFGSVYLI
jgi:voltage-gated potassium channel